MMRSPSCSNRSVNICFSYSSSIYIKSENTFIQSVMLHFSNFLFIICCGKSLDNLQSQTQTRLDSFSAVNITVTPGHWNYESWIVCCLGLHFRMRSSPRTFLAPNRARGDVIVTIVWAFPYEVIALVTVQVSVWPWAFTMYSLGYLHLPTIIVGPMHWSV